VLTLLKKLLKRGSERSVGDVFKSPGVSVAVGKGGVEAAICRMASVRSFWRI
jgi:hypothetical protein